MQDIETTPLKRLTNDMSPYLGSKYQSPITSRSPSPSIMEQSTIDDTKFASEDEISVGCPSPAFHRTPSLKRSREPSPVFHCTPPSPKRLREPSPPYHQNQENNCRCPSDSDAENDYFKPLKKLKMVEADKRISPTVDVEERQDGVKSFSISDILNHKPAKPQCTRIVRPWDIDPAVVEAHHQRLESLHRQLKVQQQLALLRPPDFGSFNASYTSETGSDRSSSVASDCCSPDIVSSSVQRQRQQQQHHGKQVGVPGATPLDALFQMTSKTFDSSAGESSADFQSHFRLKRHTVEVLINLIQPYTTNANGSGTGRPPISIDKKVLLFLWMASNNCVYRDISERFNVSMGAAWNYFREICVALVKLAPQLIQWPRGNEARVVIDGFKEKKGFPNVLGAIDGTHIEILKPQKNGESYFNRKKRYTIQAQLICDHRKMITDFFSGFPGSVHDTRVFRNSPFRREIERGTIQFPNNSHLLGDSGYVNTSYLLTPYRDDGFLTDIKKNYNFIHSGTRVIAEQAIGLWKGKFRILRYLNILNTEEIPDILLALAVLHNICIGAGDDENDIYMDESGHDEFHIGDNDPVGDRKRDQIALELFCDRT